MSDAASSPIHLIPAPHRQLLESSRLLRGLTPAQLAGIAAIWEERVYEPGEYLLREGERDGFVYVLVEGRALLGKESSLGTSALTLVPDASRPPNSVLSFILIFWTVIPVIMSLRRSPFPRASHGLTMRHAGRHAIQALVWTAPVLLACLLVKLVLTRTVASMAERPLFDPAALFAGGPVNWGFFAVAVLLYAVRTPIQEFVARAGLQGSLQQFLRVPAGHADWKSLIISNIVFASAHTYLGFSFAIAAFASGLLWGWIFARQGSLVGPIVSHLAVGSWVLFVLGLHAVIGGG